MPPVRIESGQTALITGASRGIGAALAERLARRGVRLGLVARGKEELAKQAAALPQSPAGPHLALVADVSKRGGLTRAVDRFAKQAGAIDLLVANAGVLEYAPLAEQDMDAAER